MPASPPLPQMSALTPPSGLKDLSGDQEMMEPHEASAPSLSKRLADAAHKTIAITDLGQRRSSLAPALDPAQQRNAMCTQFQVKETGRKTDVLFVPVGLRLPAAKVVELATRTWKLTPPNVLLSCDAGTVHPKAFASRELCKLEQFRDLWSQATLQASRHLSHLGDAELGGPSKGGDGSTDAATLSLVNNVLFQKLTTIFSAVVDSAAMSNNWIVVDRTTSKSPAAELLLEAALAQTTQRPTVLVIDRVERFHNFTSEQTTRHLEHLATLRQGAQPFGADASPDVETLDRFNNWRDFMDPEAFHNLPLPREPEQGHMRDDGSVADRVKWQYHYLQTSFGSGTHYIYLEGAHDTFDVSPLGPLGFVCANGQGIMYERLRQRIQNGESLVMLHNTGGVTQAFASLHRAMLSEAPPPGTAKLLRALELVSPEPWTREFGLAEITMMRELMQRAPRLLRKTVTQVDVLYDTSEEVLAMLTSCFAGRGGVPELGLGEAETMTSLTAWKRHISLHMNAERFDTRATVMQMLVYALGITTTILAIVYTENRDSEALGTAMVIMPVATGLLSTLRSRLRYREKWSACMMAAHQVVSEIYKFRLRALEYDVDALALVDDDGDGEADVNPKLREAQVRSDFVDRVADIYGSAVASEVSKGGALKHTSTTRLDCSVPEDRAVFQRSLARHVERKLYNRRPAKDPAQRERRQGGSVGRRRMPKATAVADAMVAAVEDGVAGVADNAAGVGVGGKPVAQLRAIEVDDFVSPLSIETYIDHRVRPLAAYLEQRVPMLSRQLQGCEAIALLCNAAGACVAVVGHAEWVALAVAVSAAFNALADYFYLTSQVSAANGAMQDVHALLSWWDSLSLVQRKTRQARARAVETAENAILSAVGAMTAQSASAKAGKGDDPDAGGSGEGESKGGKEKKK